MRTRGTSLLCLMALALPMQAQTGTKDWTLSGFGTLGLAWHSDDRVGYMRDLSQPLGTTRELDGRLDSRLGLQVNGRLTDSLHVTAQVVSKYQYDHTFKPEITWAFLGWSPTSDLLVRFGRVGYDIFMDSDSRNVGYSYLWVRPPVEHFGGIPVSHVDGIDIANTFPMGSNATFKLKAFAGLAAERAPFNDTTLNLTGGRLGGLVAEVSGGAWRGRLAYGFLRTRHDFPDQVKEMQMGLNASGAQMGDPGLSRTADELRFSERTLRFSTATLTYEDGPWQTQAVLGYFRRDLLVAPNAWTGYLSCGYRVGQVVPYGAWSRSVSDHPEPYLGGLPYIPPEYPGGEQAARLVGGVRQFVASNQMNRYTLTLGARWDLASRASLKVQADRIHSHRSAGLWHLSPMDSQGTVDGWSTVLSAVLDFIF